MERKKKMNVRTFHSISQLLPPPPPSCHHHHRQYKTHKKRHLKHVWNIFSVLKKRIGRKAQISSTTKHHHHQRAAKQIDGDIQSKSCLLNTCTYLHISLFGGGNVVGVTVSLFSFNEVLYSNITQNFYTICFYFPLFSKPVKTISLSVFGCVLLIHPPPIVYLYSLSTLHIFLYIYSREKKMCEMFFPKEQITLSLKLRKYYDALYCHF